MPWASPGRAFQSSSRKRGARGQGTSQHLLDEEGVAVSPLGPSRDGPRRVTELPPPPSPWWPRAVPGRRGTFPAFRSRCCPLATRGPHLCRHVPQVPGAAPCPGDKRVTLQLGGRREKRAVQGAIPHPLGAGAQGCQRQSSSSPAGTPDPKTEARAVGPGIPEGWAPEAVRTEGDGDLRVPAKTPLGDGTKQGDAGPKPARCLERWEPAPARGHAVLTPSSEAPLRASHLGEACFTTRYDLGFPPRPRELSSPFLPGPQLPEPTRSQ